MIKKKKCCWKTTFFSFFFIKNVKKSYLYQKTSSIERRTGCKLSRDCIKSRERDHGKSHEPSQINKTFQHF
jgi:hypothetical protein